MTSVGFIYKFSSWFSFKNSGTSKRKKPLEQLKRIENIFKQGLKNSSLLSAEEKELTEAELQEKLVKEVDSIRDTYLKKTLKISFLKRLFGFRPKEKAVNDVYNSIQNSIHNSTKPLLDLPNELTQHIVSFLPVKDARNLGSAVQSMVGSIQYAEIVKARGFGYLGGDLREAKAYLNVILSVVKALVKNKDIPKYKSLSADAIFLELKKSNNKEKLNQALLKYAARGSFDKVTVLLIMGANVNARDENEATPLHLAAKYGHLETVKLLVEKGADLEAKDKELKTPLFEALDSGNNLVSKFLVGKRANLDAKTNNGSTPLMFAGAKKRVSEEIMELLLKNGAAREINLRNHGGNTALHFAAHYDEAGKVKLLLHYQADRAITNNNGKRPIDVAKRQAKKLLE